MLVRRCLEVCAVVLGVTVSSFFIISLVVTGIIKPIVAGLIFLLFIAAILLVNGRMFRVFLQNWRTTNMFKGVRVFGVFLLMIYSFLLIVFLIMGLPDFLQNEVGCPLCP
jgi:hypothetical protein